MKAVSQKGHEDVRFDAAHLWMENRAYFQIAFERAERFLHLDSWQIKLPEFRG